MREEQREANAVEGPQADEAPAADMARQADGPGREEGRAGQPAEGGRAGEEAARKKRGQLPPRWYVIQVATGNEENMCQAIARACERHDEQHAGKARHVGLRECFNPKFARRRKRMGEWHDVLSSLLPGYVLADARNPSALTEALRGMQDFSRVLASNETYSPLNEAERQWLDSQTTPGNRVVPLSFAGKEGDKLVVTEGPLKGNEAMITKLDRKNCIAHVEFHAGPITLKTTVGLVIMPSGTVRQV